MGDFSDRRGECEKCHDIDVLVSYWLSPDAEWSEDLGCEWPNMGLVCYSCREGLDNARKTD